MNQVESGYVKGISKLFIDSLQGLGANNRPIHCTDKKRKTLYIKENNEWDKEGSQDTLKKGIQEFYVKCLDIQRNLIPTAPRKTSMGKIASNITANTIVSDNLNTLT